VLEQVAAPTLVAVGDRDVPGFREMSAVLARRIPGAQYQVVSGAGHMASTTNTGRSAAPPSSAASSPPSTWTARTS
jgi:pimeloyl-ACP methyl ester carboxylesterase